MATLTANEQLIEEVFEAMVASKPALQAVMLLGQEEGMEMDRRLLADQIIRGYPWPIGVELRRLFSGGMRNADRRRLDQLFRTMERTMQFLAFMMLSQAWKERKAGTLQLTDGFLREFPRRFEQLSLGNLAWAVRELGKAMSTSGITWFVPEMSGLLVGRFYDTLDQWVPERNEIGHYQVNLTQEDIERRCLEGTERLGVLLRSMAFLCKYKLVSVQEIQVHKPRFKEPMFHHRIGLLNSSDSDFKAGDLDDRQFTESRSVLLLKNLRSIEEYLNFSPLIIDTHAEAIDAKDKLEIRKDIFLYTKIKGDHLMYTGTEATDKCDLRALNNYQDLLEDFRDMITVMSTP